MKNMKIILIKDNNTMIMSEIMIDIKYIFVNRKYYHYTIDVENLL